MAAKRQFYSWQTLYVYMRVLYVSFNVMKYQKEVLGFVGINFLCLCSFKGGWPKTSIHRSLAAIPHRDK